MLGTHWTCYVQNGNSQKENQQMKLEKWLKIPNSKQNNPIQSYNFKEEAVPIGKQKYFKNTINFTPEV